MMAYGGMMKIGDRVGAIASMSSDTVRLYGYGKFVGEEVPPADVLFLGRPMERRNPKIVLDSGKTVWGCESYWGSEAAVKKAIGRRTVVDVDIEQERAKASPKASTEAVTTSAEAKPAARSGELL